MTTATFKLFESGTGSLTIGKTAHAIRGISLDDARTKARIAVAEHAASTGETITMNATEPDGRTFTVLVAADGSISAPNPKTNHTEPAAPEPENSASEPDTPPAQDAPQPYPTDTSAPASSTVQEDREPRTLRHTRRRSPLPAKDAPTPAPAPEDETCTPAPEPEQPTSAAAITFVPDEPPASPAPATETTEQNVPFVEPAPSRRALREKARETSLLTSTTNEAPATTGWRGALNALGLQLAPSDAERAERTRLASVSRHWTGPRTIAVVNGKGGSGKTPSTILLSAVFARYGGSGVVALDNNPTRGTLGWRTRKGSYDASIADLLPNVQRLTSAHARAAEMEAFVHHQIEDRYDVLRSRPEVLATEQPGDTLSYYRVHEVLAKYYRLVFVDSGNDESSEAWQAMIERADAIVVPTITRPEHAESARLLLAELARADAHSADLAENALVIVSQASKGEPKPDELVATFKDIARDAVGIPYDVAMAGRPLLLDSLHPTTRRAWVQAGAALAAALDD